MALTRRDALKATSLAAGCIVAGDGLGGVPPCAAAVAQVGPGWIAYPGQLAAWRLQRRIKLAVERCCNIGYPANFRQPVTQAYFRRSGVALTDTDLRWSGPVGRIRVTLGEHSGDMTSRKGVIRKGEANIVVHIDFAQSLPAFYLQGDAFSTNEQWEASLDGAAWVAAEVLECRDPGVLPDADLDGVVALKVARVVEPAGPAAEEYSIAAGQDLIVDFRDAELGALHFAARGAGSLRVQIGESVAEVSDPDPKNFEQYALPVVSLGPLPAREVMPERALRFARFSTTGAATVSEIGFDAKRHTSEPRGTFTCSDPELNMIWNVAVATLRSNMHDFYLDGIRRDGLVWHDGPLCLAAYERVFFSRDLSRQTLVAQTAPERPKVGDFGIIDSPMYDIIGFDQEYQARGDIGFARMFKDRIEDSLSFLAGLQGEGGFINAGSVQPYGFFPDWSASEKTGPDPHGTPSYGQMLLAGAFAAGGRLAIAWGDTSLGAHYTAKSVALGNAVREKFLQASGLYSNGLTSDGRSDERFTPFAQAYAVEFGVAKPNEIGPLFAFLDDQTKRPANYSLSQVIELSAYAKAGRAQAAVARLKSAWLPMIKRGYTRFFEDIDPAKSADGELAMYGRKYAASLCHAWAGAAPVMAISRGVLGIEPLEPGYRRCRIRPQSSGLKFAMGCVPSPHGDIEVHWDGAAAAAKIPAGVTALINDREVSGPANTAFRLHP